MNDTIFEQTEQQPQQQAITIQDPVAQFESVKAAVLKQAEQIEALVITEETIEASKETIKDGKDMIKKIDDKRRQIKQPIDELVRQIQATSKSLTATLEGPIQKKAKVINDYEQQQYLRKQAIAVTLQYIAAVKEQANGFVIQIKNILSESRFASQQQIDDMASKKSGILQLTERLEHPEFAKYKDHPDAEAVTPQLESLPATVKKVLDEWFGKLQLEPQEQKQIEEGNQPQQPEAPEFSKAEVKQHQIESARASKQIKTQIKQDLALPKGASLGVESSDVERLDVESVDYRFLSVDTKKVNAYIKENKQALLDRISQNEGNPVTIGGITFSRKINTRFV